MVICEIESDDDDIGTCSTSCLGYPKFPSVSCLVFNQSLLRGNPMTTVSFPARCERCIDAERQMFEIRNELIRLNEEAGDAYVRGMCGGETDG